jgi:hypothetical protein
METSLLAAARLGWIDGIMLSYNYRLMVTDKMRRAVDACAKAEIGWTAMKTQATFTANFYALNKKNLSAGEKNAWKNMPDKQTPAFSSFDIRPDFRYAGF